MIRIISQLFALFILLSISLLAQPQINFDEESYDFGNIRQGDVVTHHFVIRNNGNEDLQIERVRASCGCTAAAPDKDVLTPGDSTTVKVTFDSNGRKGVQKKYVYVFSNDPKRKQVRLSFTTKILLPDELDAKKVEKPAPKIAVSQNYIDYGDITVGETKNVELNVLNRGKGDLVIKDIQTTCGCIKTNLKKRKLVQGEITFLNIQITGESNLGKLTRTVSLVTNDSHNAEAVITIHANIVKGEDS